MADVRGYSQAVLPQFQGRDLANDINIGQQKVAQQRLLQKEEYYDYLSTIEMPDSVPTSYQPLFRPIIRDLIGVKSEAWKAKESGDTEKYNQLERKAGNIQSQLLDLADVSKEAYAISGKNLDVLKKDRDDYDPEEFAKREAKVAFGLDPTRADVSITTNQDGDLMIGDSSAFELLRANVLMPVRKFSDWWVKGSEPFGEFSKTLENGAVVFDEQQSNNAFNSFLGSGNKTSDDAILWAISQRLNKDIGAVTNYDVNTYGTQPETEELAREYWNEFQRSRVNSKAGRKDDGGGNEPVTIEDWVSKTKIRPLTQNEFEGPELPQKGLTIPRNANVFIRVKNRSTGQAGDVRGAVENIYKVGNKWYADAYVRENDELVRGLPLEANDISNIETDLQIPSQFKLDDVVTYFGGQKGGKTTPSKPIVVTEESQEVETTWSEEDPL